MSGMRSALAGFVFCFVLGPPAAGSAQTVLVVEQPEVTVYTTLVGRARALDVSPEGVACAGDLGVVFFDLDLRALWSNFDIAREAVVESTPPVRWFYEDHTEWREREGKRMRHIPIWQTYGHPQTVHDVLILDHVLTAGNDGAIRYLDLRTGKETLRKRGFSVNGEDIVSVWDRGKKVRPGPPDMTPIGSWSPGVYSLDVSPDGRFFASYHGNSELRVYKAAPPYALVHNFKSPYGRRMSRGRVTVAVYNDSWFALHICSPKVAGMPAVKVNFWKHDSKSLIAGVTRELTPGYHRVLTASFVGGDARWAVIGCGDGRVELFDVPGQKFIREFIAVDGPVKKYDGWGEFTVIGTRPQAHMERVDVLSVSEDGKLLISASTRLADGDCMRLWEVDTGRELCRFNLDGEAVWDAEFFREGILTVGESMRYWQIPQGIWQERLAAKPTDLSARTP